MDLKGLGTIIAKDAPLLGSIIGSINPIAGLIVNAVATLFGANAKDPTDIAQKINQDPDAAIKLKGLEMQHEEAIYQSQIDDRKSARVREEAIVKITGKRDYLLDIIAFIVIFGYLIMCAFLVFNKLNNENNQVLYMMFGQLTGGFIMVLSYYFGSSNK